MAQNLLLFGATGQIGSFILESILTSRNSFNRVAILTSTRTAETKSAYLNKLQQHKIEIIIGDIEDENAIKAAYKGKSSTPLYTQPSPSSKLTNPRN